MSLQHGAKSSSSDIREVEGRERGGGRERGCSEREKKIESERKIQTDEHRVKVETNVIILMMMRRKLSMNINEIKYGKLL